MNQAVTTDRSRDQWIDLGVHTEACMTRPETCGAAGGAVSFWVMLTNECRGAGVIISSVNYEPTATTGFGMRCFGDELRQIHLFSFCCVHVNTLFLNK